MLFTQELFKTILLPEQYIRKDETTPMGFLLKPKNPKEDKEDTSSKIEKESEEKDDTDWTPILEQSRAKGLKIFKSRSKQKLERSKKPIAKVAFNNVDKPYKNLVVLDLGRNKLFDEMEFKWNGYKVTDWIEVRNGQPEILSHFGWNRTIKYKESIKIWNIIRGCLIDDNDDKLT